MIAVTCPAADFFATVAKHFPAAADVDTLMITHLLAERPPFVDAVNAISQLQAVLPKPRSVDPGTHAMLTAAGMRVDPLSREQLTDPDAALDYLEGICGGRDVVLLDVGGYFAAALPSLCRRFSGRIVGVVEDTENGHRRYEHLNRPPCPIYSVARSPLKSNEDQLVGQAVVFSTEAILRSQGLIITGWPTTVIGFGKLGRAAAHTLRARGARVTVYDTDPVRATHALADGFPTAPQLPAAVRDANLLICATGNTALPATAYAHLPSGAYIASVTSADDELDLAHLAGNYTLTHDGAHLTRCQRADQSFWLLAGGSAVNFVHGAGSAGEFIYLVQAEILAALSQLTHGQTRPGYHAVPDTDRRLIAELWMSHFSRNTQP